MLKNSDMHIINETDEGMRVRLPCCIRLQSYRPPSRYGMLAIGAINRLWFIVYRMAYGAALYLWLGP